MCEIQIKNAFLTVKTDIARIIYREKTETPFLKRAVSGYKEGG